MPAASDPSAQRNAAADLPTAKRTLLDRFWFGPARLKAKRTWFMLFMVVTAILFCRQPGAILHPTFYAEDGKIFFKRQYEEGFAKALLTRYAGYLHFTPRIVAGICGPFPVEYTPGAYAAVSLLLAAAVMTFFFAQGFRAVVDNDSLRVAIVIVMTLMPNAEPLMKAAYLNWHMVFFLALVTMYVLPQSVWLRCLIFVPAAVTAWSTPVAIVCLPLILVRAWDGANWRERLWWMVLALLLIAYPLSAERPPSVVGMLLHEQDWKWALLHSMTYRVFDFFFFGEALMYPFPSEGWAMMTGIGLLLFGICAAGAAWSNPEGREINGGFRYFWFI